MNIVKFTLLSLLIVLSITFFSSCKDTKGKDPIAVLPPITTEGLNTFGCLIDGEVWVPERKIDIQCNYYPRHDFLDERLWGTLSFSSTRKSKFSKFTLVSISHKEIFGKSKKYLHNDGPASNKGGGGLLSFSSGDAYRTINGINDLINIIELDSIRKIISGTFEFDAVNKYEPFDTVKVRNGRFDLEFRY